MDDLDFPTAEAVPTFSSSALPPSSIVIPRAIDNDLRFLNGGHAKASSKPSRYETGIETTPLTPPSSSHNLQLVFDSSKIYDDHPHKYRLLLETDKSATTAPPNAAVSKPSIPPTVTVEDGHVVAMGNTSSGPGIGPTIPSATPDAAVPKTTATAAAAGAPFTLSEAVSSLSVKKKEPGESRYVPQEFLQTFKAATTLQPPSPKKSQQRASSFSAQGSPSFFAEGPQTSSKIPTSGGMPNMPVIKKNNSPMPQLQAPERIVPPAGCTVVQPEPRRLFGFGPFYRPLPETICATGGRRQSSPTLHVPTGLSETVAKEGITGQLFSKSRRGSAAVDSSDGGVAGATKKSPTPAELNVWLGTGGSF